MPIQFLCQQCGKTLNVADEHAGKSASCPECKTVTKIPDGNVVPSDNPFEQTTPSNFDGSGLSQNPYASPTKTAPKPKPFSGTGPIRPRKVSFDEVFSSAWELWKDNLGLLVGVTVVVMLINFAFSFVAGVTQGIVLTATNDELTAILASQVVSLSGGVFGLFLGIGQLRIFLDIARGRNASFETLFFRWRPIPAVTRSDDHCLHLPVAGFFAFDYPRHHALSLFLGILFSHCRSKGESHGIVFDGV